MDILSEICAIKDGEYLTGTYYSRQPKTTADAGEKFSYGILDPKSREYRTLVGNLWLEGKSLAIKTRSSINFVIKGYVAIQSGELYQIVATIENIETEQSRQALRFFKDTAQTEKIIRLIGVENPMELK